jgi:hypothetical protein
LRNNAGFTIRTLGVGSTCNYIDREARFLPAGGDNDVLLDATARTLRAYNNSPGAL